MGWVESKSLGFFLPAVADEFVGSHTHKSFESAGEVVGGDEVAEMGLQLAMAVVVIALHGGLLDGAVHAFDLPVGLGMVRFGQPMIDAMRKADPVKRMSTKAGSGPLTIFWQVGKLNSIVGEHGVDAVWDRCDKRFEKSGGSLHVGAFDQLHESELGGAVDGDEQIELAFGGAHPGQVDVEVADRIALEPLPFWPIAFGLRQPTDAVAQETAMQR